MLMIMSYEEMLMWQTRVFANPQPQGHCKCIANVEIQEPIKMKTPQEKAAELLPFVQALANGEEVLEGEYEATGNFIHGIVFSIKPKMMLVNGFEVPEPMRGKPKLRGDYFTPNVLSANLFICETWFNNDSHLWLFDNGLCHQTKEAAIAHAKAMLNIDQNGGE